MGADHTPGPWTVKNDPANPTAVVVDCGDSRVYVNGFKDWKSNADRARLIAAAPDLLAALEVIESQAAAFISPVALAIFARAAITKAKGES